jgi:hypothetical protein
VLSLHARKRNGLRFKRAKLLVMIRVLLRRAVGTAEARVPLRGSGSQEPQRWAVRSGDQRVRCARGPKLFVEDAVEQDPRCEFRDGRV